MSIEFSDAVNNDGIVQEVRDATGIDASQWPTQRIANSCNRWKNFLTGYAIGADKRFRWDGSNHTKLPEGTTDLTLNGTDYSFLTDEQGNAILTLTGLSLVDANGIEYPLRPVDVNDPDYDLSTFGKGSGMPTQYDKISDNIIRLDKKPTAAVVSAYDLKFRFQRTAVYYTASNTTEQTGFSPLLDNGFIIAASYDIARRFGLQNLQALMQDKRTEIDIAVQYFANRSEDEETILTPASEGGLININF